MPLRLLSLSCLVAAFCAAPALAQNDQVYGRNGVPTRGTIMAVSPTEVTMTVTGGERAFETKDILKVTFADEPSELTTGRDRALAGQYEDGLAELKKIDPASLPNEVIRQDAAYYFEYCSARLALTAGRDKGEASKSLRDFLGQNQKSFHFFEGVELLGDLYYASGDFDQAAKFYQLLSQSNWPDYTLRSAMLQGRALSAAGNQAAALAMYEQILSSGLATPEVVEQKLQATVGKAVCLAATGKPDEGIAMIEDLIAKNDPRDATLFARAYNALGACYQKVGKKDEALQAYLHTDLLFFSDLEAHAEALYHLAALWADAKQSDRAVQARSLLQSRYAGSRWATMP